MVPAHYDNLLHTEGFQKIGELTYRLHLTAWWNPAPEKLLQVVVLNVGGTALVKADKSYFLKSVTPEGETWARDIGLLHDWLEAHFPELRIAFSHFRDVPADLAQKEVKRRMAIEAPTQPIPTVEQVARLQQQWLATQQDSRTMKGMIELMAGETDLLSGYLHQQSKMQDAQINEQREELDRERQRLGIMQHVQREYQRKGSAAVFNFCINSNVHAADEHAQFVGAVRSVVKELTDMHRYQVTQKLGGGRLNIQVAEATEPAISWIEQWFGGAITPMQLRRVNARLQYLRHASDEHIIVTPDAPIIVNEHVRHAEKHLAARFVSTVLQRLDKSDGAMQKAALSPETIPVDLMPLALGWHLDGSGRMTGPAAFPLTHTLHASVSGTTGSGKSYLARVIVEEAAQYKSLSVLVLDPRNQSIGLLIPEDRPKVLQQYEAFGMKPGRARGFGFNYFAPGLPYASPLPADMSALSRGHAIVSFKGLNDEQRCATASKVLHSVFEACNAQECESPRLLVLIDEAQLFTRKRVDESAKQAAAGSERAIDRIAREGRKFGLCLVLVSQTMKDFGYELAAIRQMTTTKIFLRNSDREIEYAGDIIGDGRQLVQLPTGTALIHNAHWGLARIRVRPPYSKVFELAEADVRRLIGSGREQSRTTSIEAQRVFNLIKAYGPTPERPLNMSQVGESAGISSKRRLLELIGELEQAGAIRTRKLLERGRPRIVELV